MERDPNGGKIGRNHKCWCGSGLKFKFCHYSRDSQVSKPFGFYESKFYEIEKDTQFCSCGFDAGNCDAVIARAHSVSKSASLSEIQIDGHVNSLEIDPSLYSPGQKEFES